MILIRSLVPLMARRADFYCSQIVRKASNKMLAFMLYPPKTIIGESEEIWLSIFGSSITTGANQIVPEEDGSAKMSLNVAMECFTALCILFLPASLMSISSIGVTANSGLINDTTFL